MVYNPNADAGSGAAQIPLQGVGVQINPMENIGKAYTLADLMQRTQMQGNAAVTSNIQTQDMLATRQALGANTKQDPQTGQMAIDIPGTLRDLNKVSPTAAVNFQMSMQQRQAELAEKQATLQQTQLGNALSRVNLVGQLVQHVDNQEDLDRVRTHAGTLGIDPQMIPQTYDPKEKEQLVSQAVKASEMLNNKIEMSRLKLTAAKNTSEIVQADAAAANEVAGQYKDDPYVKEYIALSNTYQSFKSMESTKDFAQGIKDRDLLYNFQNVINPNRSATGGTIEQDEEARSTLENMGVDVKKIVSGGTLAPSQRQQIAAFINQKYKDTTLQAQAVFNQYQNRLINLRAIGRNVDPYHTLPMYGGVRDHAPPGAEDYGTTQKPEEAEAQPAAGIKLNAPGRVLGMDEVVETAKRYGKTPDQVLKDAKAKGYQIEGM